MDTSTATRSRAFYTNTCPSERLVCGNARSCSACCRPGPTRSTPCARRFPGALVRCRLDELQPLPNTLAQEVVGMARDAGLVGALDLSVDRRLSVRRDTELRNIMLLAAQQVPSPAIPPHSWHDGVFVSCPACWVLSHCLRSHMHHHFSLRVCVLIAESPSCSFNTTRPEMYPMTIPNPGWTRYCEKTNHVPITFAT